MTFYKIGWFSFICHLHGLVVLREQKIMSSVDQLIIQKRKLDFLITKLYIYQFEAVVFNQERLSYCT